MTSLSKRIADRLVKARKDANLTQEEVARRAGAPITAQYVSRLERAVSDAPRRHELHKVAQVFGLTADELMGFGESVPQDETPTESVDVDARSAGLAEIALLVKKIPDASISLADLGRGAQDWDDDDVEFVLRRLRRLAEQFGRSQTAC